MVVLTASWAWVAWQGAVADDQPHVKPALTRCATAASLQVAQKSLAAAERLIARSNYRQANRALMAGLSALGGSCHTAAQIDDTGMQLAAALGEEHAGHWEAAARMRASVLRSRLSLCRP